MKIRNAFVSNSSSTSFTFCFKGNDIETLYAMILKYNKYFKLAFNCYDDITYSCNALDIVNSIKCVMKSNEKAEEWCKIKIVPVDDIVKREEESIKEYEKEIEKEEKEKNPNRTWSIEYLEQDIRHCEKTIKNFERIKKNGLDHAIQIGFGDNHGEVCGGDIGYSMDYEGRSIHILEKDFAVFTEQNR